MKKHIQKIVVAGILIKDGKALILQRNKDEKTYPNLWELPSGKKEILEQTEDGLKREFKEETGLDIEIVSPISIFDYSIEKTDEIVNSTQINFLVSTIDKNIHVKLSNEHQDYAWIDNSDIHVYNISESTRLTIEKAFIHIKN